MGGHIVFYIFYGLITGLAEFLPVSASAQGFLLTELTSLNTRHPLMLLLTHMACLAVVLIHCRHRIGHMRRELHLHTQPPGRRKRQPDRVTVLDAKLVIVGLIPTVVCLAFSDYVYQKWTNTIVLALALFANGIVIYVPPFQPGANRDARHMTPAEGVLLGTCAGLSAIPGISRMGCFISAGLLRGCDRRYIVDIALLASVPALAIMMVLDAVSLIAMGSAAFAGNMLLFSGLAAVAAFAGAWLAVAILRFVSVNANYTAFAYYSWGLGMFSLIVYLMV